MDPFNTYWQEKARGVEVQVLEYKKVRAQGVGFVDDKKPIEETVERVNEWLCGSTGFGGFHGVEQRPQKCEGGGGHGG